jgi:inner membrane protein
LDTGTHLVVGLGLAGLAYIDPVVASNGTVATAVLIGTVLGSQAPDSDGLLRLRGNAVYIRNHRGLSHSIPAIVLWTLGITGLLSLLFRDLPTWHVAMWVLLAVCLHVFSDLFNTYGTQAFRPLTERWVSWNIIHIFDPIIFTSHLLAIFMWIIHAFPPQHIFPVLYALLALYYVWRTIDHHVLESGLPKKDAYHEAGDRYWLIPTVNLYVWNIVKRQSSGHFVVGELRNNQIKWLDSIACSRHPAVEKSRSHPDIAAFLYFCSYACAEVREHDFGYEVRWMDIRYQYRKQYPFVAVVLMNFQFEPLDSYVGWVSDQKLEKKLGVQLSPSK